MDKQQAYRLLIDNLVEGAISLVSHDEDSSVVDSYDYYSYDGMTEPLYKDYPFEDFVTAFSLVEREFAVQVNLYINGILVPAPTPDKLITIEPEELKEKCCWFTDDYRYGFDTYYLNEDDKYDGLYQVRWYKTTNVRVEED